MYGKGEVPMLWAASRPMHSPGSTRLCWYLRYMRALNLRLLKPPLASSKRLGFSEMNYGDVMRGTSGR